MRVLSIESSCDDTSVALVDSSGFVHFQFSADQNSAHAPFGGVVPEIASRNHTLQILPLVEALLKKASLSLQDVDGFVVTNRPGLIGALMVGVVTAKALAWITQKPVIGVNHLEGHLYAPFLADQEWTPILAWDEFAKNKMKAVALAVSGGHTQLYELSASHKPVICGATIDDAAGEALDKLAKLLGLPFPGGAYVDRLAQTGDSSRYKFPRPLIHEDHFQMSFSGLKTAALKQIQSLTPEEIEVQKPHLCASFEQAIVDVLFDKLKRLQELKKAPVVLLTGGVSANTRLRKTIQEWCQKKGLEFLVPPLRYCTDNAAMMGLLGALKLSNNHSSSQDLAPKASSDPQDFQYESH